MKAEVRGLQYLIRENGMDGQMDKVKGRVKQAVGDLTHNK